MAWGGGGGGGIDKGKAMEMFMCMTESNVT